MPRGCISDVCQELQSGQEPFPVCEAWSFQWFRESIPRVGPPEVTRHTVIANWLSM